MGYRNWRQRWCKKEGNKVLGKEKRDKNPTFSTFFGSVTFNVLNIGFLSHFSFPKTLLPSFLHHVYPNSYIPPTFSVRECFSLLVYPFELSAILFCMPSSGLNLPFAADIFRFGILIICEWINTTYHLIIYVH